MVGEARRFWKGCLLIKHHDLFKPNPRLYTMLSDQPSYGLIRVLDLTTYKTKVVVPNDYCSISEWLNKQEQIKASAKLTGAKV